jgi:DNA-binding NarL/FixJ family response regulator
MGKEVTFLPRDNSLSKRQVEVLRLIAEGKSSKEIARRLGISFQTVAYHRKEVMLKTGIHNLADLVQYAIRESIIKLP